MLTTQSHPTKLQVHSGSTERRRTDVQAELAAIADRYARPPTHPKPERNHTSHTSIASNYIFPLRTYRASEIRIKRARMGPIPSSHPIQPSLLPSLLPPSLHSTAYCLAAPRRARALRCAELNRRRTHLDLASSHRRRRRPRLRSRHRQRLMPSACPEAVHREVSGRSIPCTSSVLT